MLWMWLCQNWPLVSRRRYEKLSFHNDLLEHAVDVLEKQLRSIKEEWSRQQGVLLAATQEKDRQKERHVHAWRRLLTALMFWNKEVLPTNLTCVIRTNASREIMLLQHYNPGQIGAYLGPVDVELSPPDVTRAEMRVFGIKYSVYLEHNCPPELVMDQVAFEVAAQVRLLLQKEYAAQSIHKDKQEET